MSSMEKELKSIQKSNLKNVNKIKNAQNLSNSFNQNNSNSPKEVVSKGVVEITSRKSSITKTDEYNKRKTDTNSKFLKEKILKNKIRVATTRSDNSFYEEKKPSKLSEEDGEKLKKKMKKYVSNIFQKYDLNKTLDENNEKEEEEKEEVDQEWDRNGYFDRLSLIEEEIEDEEDEEEEEEEKENDEEEEKEDEKEEEEGEAEAEKEEKEEKYGEDEKEEDAEDEDDEEEKEFDEEIEKKYRGSKSSLESTSKTSKIDPTNETEDEKTDEEEEREVEEIDSKDFEKSLDNEDEETKERNKYYHEKRDQLHNLTNGELLAKINDFSMQEKILQIENYMFECYLDKIFAVRNRKKRKMSKQEYKINLFTKRVTMAKAISSSYDNRSINISQRLEIVEQELKTLKSTIKNETTRAIEVIKRASFDVIDLSRQLVSLKEKIKKFDELIESNTNVTKGSGKPKDVLKLWQEEIQKLETRILKYRLKKVALKLHLSKMQSLSNQAEETNEILSENDINLLKIGNQVLSRNIKAGNENLLVLKITAGKMRLKLNSLKTKLIEAEKVSNQMASKITMANDQAEKSMAEINHNTKDLSRIKKQIQHIYQYINAYSVPEVIEYAKFVENLPPLERQIKHYGRKIEVKKAEIKKKEKALKNQLSFPKKNETNKCLY